MTDQKREALEKALRTSELLLSDLRELEAQLPDNDDVFFMNAQFRTLIKVFQKIEREESLKGD